MTARGVLVHFTWLLRAGHSATLCCLGVGPWGGLVGSERASALALRGWGRQALHWSPPERRGHWRVLLSVHVLLLVMVRSLVHFRAVSPQTSFAGGRKDRS